MTSYEWRLSGQDARQHAFQAEAGFIERIDVVAVFEPSFDPEQPSEFFGPYEAYRAECGLIVPVAMLMPNAAGQVCAACRVRTGALVPIGQSAYSATLMGPNPYNDLTLANNC